MPGAVGGPAAPEASPEAGSESDEPISPPAEPTEPVAVPPRTYPQHRIERTRAGGLWIAVSAAAVVLLLLLIFVLQNGGRVKVKFFAADANVPLGVALLLSAVAGVLLVVLVGTARIMQLRMVARRHRKEDAALPPS
jgi:lipopolysaccharide assembly protein A